MLLSQLRREQRKNTLRGRATGGAWKALVFASGALRVKDAEPFLKERGQ